ncbi:MAG: hypothetical protein ACPGMR_03370 [Pontibacterium sp.]
MLRPLQFAIAALLLCFSVAILTGVLIYATDPTTNHLVASKQAELDAQKLKYDIDRLSDWKWNHLADIDSNEDAYPFVMLRYGYKFIAEEDNEKFIIGWFAELANTSPNYTYPITINYTLTDIDGFSIASSSSTEMFGHESSGGIRGQIAVTKSQLSRVAKSTWTVDAPSLDWRINEERTIGTRFERLSEMVKNGKLANWIYNKSETFDDKPQSSIPLKWLAIRDAVEFLTLESQ